MPRMEPVCPHLPNFRGPIFPGEGREWSARGKSDAPFGGSAAVIDKLAYIRDLGFSALWLTPIFASPSHHGYDTSDYLRIEPRSALWQILMNW